MFLIGKVIKPFSYKGWIKVENLSDFPRFLMHDIVYIENKAYEIEQSKPGAKCLLVKLKEINSEGQAKQIAQKEIYSKSRPELKEREFVCADLLGKTVYFKNQEIGKVKEVYFYPNQQVLKIERANQTCFMLPFVKHYIDAVEESKITVLNLGEMI